VMVSLWYFAPASSVMSCSCSDSLSDSSFCPSHLLALQYAHVIGKCYPSPRFSSLPICQDKFQTSPSASTNFLLLLLSSRLSTSVLSSANFLPDSHPFFISILAVFSCPCPHCSWPQKDFFY
jgi:hypothetical protein